MCVEGYGQGWDVWKEDPYMCPQGPPHLDEPDMAENGWGCRFDWGLVIENSIS